MLLIHMLDFFFSFLEICNIHYCFLICLVLLLLYSLHVCSDRSKTEITWHNNIQLFISKFLKYIGLLKKYYVLYDVMIYLNITIFLILFHRITEIERENILS
jgi:uncharacterized membrane protein